METELPPLDEQALTELLDSIPAGVLVEDPDGSVTWVNSTLATQLGVARESLVGGPMEALPLERVSSEGAAQSLYRVTVEAEGDAKRLGVTSQRLGGQAADGPTVYFFQDVAAAAAGGSDNPVIQLLASRLSVDSDTGALDRRGILQALQSEVSRSRRYQNPLSVVAMRIAPRDPAGKAASSVLMQDAARFLKDQTRWADIIGRWEECEFLMVLPETDEDSASQLVKKVEALLDEGAPDGVPAFVASFGVAGWSRGDDAAFLLERAWRALEPEQRARA